MRTRCAQHNTQPQLELLPVVQWTMLAKNNGNTAAKIGGSALLSVDVALDEQSNMRYQLVPLKDAKERKVGQTMVLDKTGDFGLVLIDNDWHQRCSLLDKLEVSCAAEYAHACMCACKHMEPRSLRSIPEACTHAPMHACASACMQACACTCLHAHACECARVHK